MKILVINAGSSSLKFQLLESKKWQVLYKGIIDGIGLPLCEFRSSHGNKDYRQIKSQHAAFKFGIDHILASEVIKDLSEIEAVGHRIVHGGEKYVSAVKVAPTVINEIKKLSSLAPLHNPHNLEGIKASQKLLKKAPDVAIFDTAFHQTMPEKAFMYPLPEKLYKKHNIRKYGFHGTSHKYVAEEARKYLGKRKSGNLITCHLGNGASITAVKNGKSIDTSMGFTPLEGVMMGTRSGDIDPAIIFHLMDKLKMKPEKIYEMLNYESGIKGIFGKNDIRELRDEFFKKKTKKSALAFEMYCYRIAKYIGSYLVALGQLDALVFTGGIGENAWYIRKWICDYLKIELNHKKNKRVEYPQKLQKISWGTPKVLVIPTNEELQIAKETLEVLS
ncbi:MAG: acetate kinase [Patescibacteria group bacterium]|nr:acetate kinase [Patescibacteria group bacterium]